MTNLLTFDTSTDACSAAVMAAGQVCSRFEIAPRRHNQLLLPMIDAVLKEAGITCRELNAIAFGKGPGSFMGVRLATGMAQGLAFGADIPLIPISSLQTLAQSAYIKHQCHDVISAWDARMNQIYWGEYALNEHGVMKGVGEDQLSDPEDIMMSETTKRLPRHFVSRNDDVLYAGNAWHVYKEKINPDLFKQNPVIDIDIRPDAKAMLPIAEFYFKNKIGCIAADKAEPQYLRNNVAKKPGSQQK